MVDGRGSGATLNVLVGPSTRYLKEVSHLLISLGGTIPASLCDDIII